MLMYLRSLLKFRDFKGRAGYREYWVFALFQVLAVLVISFIERQLGIANPEMLAGPFTLGFLLITLLPTLAVTVRRLHDAGRSGLWTFSYLIPVLGAIFMFVLMLWRGTTGENRYGLDPRPAPKLPPS